MMLNRQTVFETVCTLMKQLRVIFLNAAGQRLRAAVQIVAQSQFRWDALLHRLKTKTPRKETLVRPILRR